MNYNIKDINLADKGNKRILWAEKEINVLRRIRKIF
jgi:S-adenosylhomocysteine hydrolase